jgi:hypothetical protein
VFVGVFEEFIVTGARVAISVLLLPVKLRLMHRSLSKDALWIPFEPNRLPIRFPIASYNLTVHDSMNIDLANDCIFPIHGKWP